MGVLAEAQSIPVGVTEPSDLVAARRRPNPTVVLAWKAEAHELGIYGLLKETCAHEVPQVEGGTGSGLRDAQYVSPRKDLGDRLSLDRGRGYVTCGGDGGLHLVAQAEL